MSGCLLSPAAQADVDEIWNYTVERWSEEQAARYVRSIRDACRELGAGTRISRPVDIRNGYRKAQVGAHMVYFRLMSDNRIVVVRILHQICSRAPFETGRACAAKRTDAPADRVA